MNTHMAMLGEFGHQEAQEMFVARRAELDEVRDALQEKKDAITSK